MPSDTQNFWSILLLAFSHLKGEVRLRLILFEKWKILFYFPNIQYCPSQLVWIAAFVKVIGFYKKEPGVN